MIEQFAVVTQRNGNLAVLEVERRTACSLCGQKRGCGNATWGKLLGHKSQTVTAENVINADVGASVVVGIDEHVFLRTVFFLYIVPLFSMLLWAVLADVFFDNEFYVVLAALTGLTLGFMLVKRYLAGAAVRKSGYAQILRHTDETTSCKNAADVNVVKFK